MLTVCCSPQILVLGKLMQPALLSWAAYRDQAVFRQRSGMAKSVLISEPRTGTQVRNSPCHTDGWHPS